MEQSKVAALVAKHADLLAQAEAACRSREYFSAYPESPSPRVYGEQAAELGSAAFQELLGRPFPLDQPNDGRRVGAERSPYGPDLAISYPHAGPDLLIDHAEAALPQWRAATPEQRASVAAEILSRLNHRSFELAHAVMHTSGQAFVMAFQAGGPQAQDRALEAVAYALAEQQRHAPVAHWEKPQGRRPPLKMIKTFTPVGRGIGLVVGCSTFPTWNSYPGLFASLVTGNAVIIKPHPRAVLPLAITVAVAREVFAECGLDPNLVLLAAEADDERLAAEFAQRPEIGIIDFTGSPKFGRWLEDHARQAQVYTEKAGVNSVIMESTDAYRAVLDNLAFTLALYTGQMCTTTQNIYLPATGVATDEGLKSPSELADDLGRAVARLLADDQRAAGILGALVSDDVAARLEAHRGRHDVVIDSRPISSEQWPDARIRTPLVRLLDAEDVQTYGQECFGPVSFLITTRDRDEARTIFADLTRRKGALTAGVYSTDESFLDEVREAALSSGVALSENLVGGVYVNQTAAFSDFHGTGANPAANACYADGHFVAGRFRVIETRRLES